MSSLQRRLNPAWVLTLVAASWLGFEDRSRGDDAASALHAIDPSGVPGRLVLCGIDTPAGVVVETFRGAEPIARLLAISIGAEDSIDLDDERLRRLCPQVAIHRAATWTDVPWKEIAITDGVFAWVHSDAPLPEANSARAAFSEWIRRLWSRQGQLVVSGRAGEGLCEAITTPVGTLTPGLGLLPGVVWRTAATRAGLGGAPSDLSGRIILELDRGGILVVQGRSLSAPGSVAAGATLWLPPGRAKQPRYVRVDREHAADLVMLRRAALLRDASEGPRGETLSPRVSRGTLVIAGGGELPEEIMQRFVKLAGGAASRIVVIPTAGEEPVYLDHRDAERLRESGAGRVVLLHTRERSVAESDAFLEPLRTATGVWFTGGRQWRLVDAYEGTPVVDLCRDVLDRGGVIGGSSAGATIQGEYLVRGHPLGNEVMMAEGYERGFGFLPGTAIDQHFTQRRRERDLESVKRAHPQLVCIGIDERTALVVDGVQAEVIGEGTASIYDRAPSASDPDRVVQRTIHRTGERFEFPHVERSME